MNVVLLELKKRELILAVEAWMKQNSILAANERLEAVEIIPKPKTICVSLSSHELDVILSTRIEEMEFEDYEDDIKYYCREREIVTLGQLTRSDYWGDHAVRFSTREGKMKKVVWGKVNGLGLEMARKPYSKTFVHPYPLGPLEQEVILGSKTNHKG